MRQRELVGTISFPTTSALALWRIEILGQLSDGAWENAEPSDHWEYWHKLRTVVDVHTRPHVVMNDGQYPPLRQKTGYNIASLYPYLGPRMLAYGRMGRVLSSRANTKVPSDPAWDERHGDKGFDAMLRGGEYLVNRGDQDKRPATLEAYLSREWDTKDNYFATYIKVLDEETVRRFFATEYTMKDLRSDVRDIKAAMKTVKEFT